MVFASSKDALRRSLVGIATEIQGTDFSEVAYDAGMYAIYAMAMSSLSSQCWTKPPAETDSIGFLILVPPLDLSRPSLRNEHECIEVER
jgi:hypothetical protein